MQIKFHITGMTCSACSTRIQKVVSKIEEINKVEVNLLTNSMIVEIDNKKDKEIVIEKIINSVKKAGFEAFLQDKDSKTDNISKEIKDMKKRLIFSFIFLIPLMYIAMGHMVNMPMPNILHDKLIFVLSQLILTIPILVINKSYFINGFKNLVKISPNMDTLIAIGSSAAFVYGIYAIFKIFIAININDIGTIERYSMNIYFESAGMIVTLITLGKYLEKKAKGKTSDAIKKLIDLSPKMATVIRNNKEERVLTKEVKVEDIVIVKPGETIPVDGTIIEGKTYIDESAITGESVEVKKEKGDTVLTATINKNGNIRFVATKVGEDTTLSQIIKLVEEASATKAPIGKLADKISGIFVPIVITIAILATIIWLIVGKDIEFALSIGIAVLVISCPCALGLATPVSIMVGTGKGAEKGILIKSSESLENAHLIDTVVLDKTGTITKGKARVTDIVLNNSMIENEKQEKNNFMQIVSSIESKSEHPISRAILEYAKENDIQIKDVDNFENISGKGIRANIEGEEIFIGNKKWMEDNNISIHENEEIKNKQNELEEKAKTVIFVSNKKNLLGIIGISDEIKEDSKKAIQQMQKENIKVIMLTGDSKKVAKSIGREINIDEENIVSEVLPQDKEKVIRELKEQGKNVAMVGDGINDSPALARANVGIAIGAGTDIAIETADIVLIKNSLIHVTTAIRLSKATIKNIKMNLFWAFFYNIIGIPIAAGVLYPSLGFTLNPMIAALAMSLSSVCVVTNALRLRKFR